MYLADSLYHTGHEPLNHTRLKCQQHLAPVDAAVQDEHIVRGLRLLLDERRLSRLAGPIDLMAGLRAAGRSVGSTESETLPTATRESVGGYAKLTFNFASPYAHLRAGS